MKAFISFAISPDEQYILNLLADKLGKRGFTLVSGVNAWPRFEPRIAPQMQDATLFIGLITRAGATLRFQNVIEEFNLARSMSKPAILLIEEGSFYPMWGSDDFNTIYFNRNNIGQAIETVNGRIHTPDTEASAAAWLLGGVAVIALLSYLSNDKKK
jgi:hypothetical protein